MSMRASVLNCPVDLLDINDAVSIAKNAIDEILKYYHIKTKDIPDENKQVILGSATTFRGGHGIQGVYVDHPVFGAVHAKDAAIGLEKQPFDTGVEVDKEKILDWDPEILFLDAGNMGLIEAEYADDPGFFEQLNAVKNGNVYQWPTRIWKSPSSMLTTQA